MQPIIQLANGVERVEESFVREDLVVFFFEYFLDNPLAPFIKQKRTDEP